MTLPPTLVAPTNSDVAALLRSRTKDLNGNELDAFTADTRPTDVQVDQLIAMAVTEVTGQVGTSAWGPCGPAATSLIAVRAAMWVELSYFPEQVRSDRSVYAELAAQWTEGLAALLACVQGNAPADGADSNIGYRFGVLDIHGWTASPYYGAPGSSSENVVPGEAPSPPPGPPT